MGYIYLDNGVGYVSIKNTSFDDILNIRTWEFKDKVEFLKNAIKDEGLKNVNVIVNISLLLKRFNNFDDEIFERDDVYFESMVELIDAKLELQSDLDDLRRKIVGLYLSIIKSLVVKNDEQSRDICDLHFLLMRILSVYDISLMLQRIELSGINAEFVRGADVIYQDMLKNE